MAKKNKATKKHRFKYAEPTGLRPATQTGTTISAGSAPAKSAPKSGPPAPRANTTPAPVAAGVATEAVVAGRDFSYVAIDLRRLGVLAASLLALELVLWYLLGHTGFGSAIYNLIQV